MIIAPLLGGEPRMVLKDGPTSYKIHHPHFGSMSFMNTCFFSQSKGEILRLNLFGNQKYQRNSFYSLSAESQQMLGTLVFSLQYV